MIEALLTVGDISNKGAAPQINRYSIINAVEQGFHNSHTCGGFKH